MEIGATVIVRGRGLGTVKEIRDGVLVVDETELKPGEVSQFEVPVASASDAIRSVVTRAEAERMLSLLATKPPRLPIAGDRAAAYRRAYRKGELEEQVRLLAAMYTGKAEPPENQYQERIEKVVYGELAFVLGLSRKALRAKIRTAAKGEAAPRSLALADRRAELELIEPPAAKGFTPIGAFAVDTRIGVGEARPDVIIDVEPGVWLAYAKQRGDDISALVAIHQSALPELAALAKQAKSVGRAAIEGAHIAIFDEAIMDDQEIVQAMWNATFEIVEGRAAVVALGGDGVGTVLTAAKRYVRVDV
jgi:RNA polymerase-interacting CarD/CdnL/TRCF family regulator